MTIDKHELVKAKFKPGCVCKGIKLVKILEAIKAGCTNFNQIAEKTGIGNGSCGGKRCGDKVRELLDENQRKD